MRIGRLVQVIILLSSFVTSDVANQLVVSDNICMKRVGMFEAKTKLSELCDEVNRTGKSILVTKRGKPYVRIVPREKPDTTGSSVWEARERYESEHGLNDTPEFPSIHREAEPVFDPFDTGPLE